MLDQRTTFIEIDGSDAEAQDPEGYWAEHIDELVCDRTGCDNPIGWVLWAPDAYTVERTEWRTVWEDPDHDVHVCEDCHDTIAEGEGPADDEWIHRAYWNQAGPNPRREQ